MDQWHSLAQDLASTGPLLPPQQWAHNNAPGLVPLTTVEHELGDQEPDDPQQPLPHQLQPGSPPPDECTEDCEASSPEPTSHWAEENLAHPLPDEHDLQPPPVSEPQATQILCHGDDNANHPTQPEDGGDPMHNVHEQEQVEVEAEEDEDDGDVEWESDESEDEEDHGVPGTTADEATKQQQQRGKPQGQQQPQPKRQSGHGSQRVKNKQRKSDVKRLWRDAGWGDKPEWLSWKEALGWLKRGARPPAKRPASKPEDRARLASLLAAHHYTRDASGAIIPPGATGDNAVPQAAHGAHLAQEPLQPAQVPAAQPAHGSGSKADTQASQDHQTRESMNPYLGIPGPGRKSTAPSTRPTAEPQGDDPREPQQHPLPQGDDPREPQQHPLPQLEDPGKAEAQARQNHRERQETNPYLQPAERRPRQAPASDTYRDDRGMPSTERKSSKQLSFQLPDDHREDPPKPTRTQHVLRKLSNSTMVQITGDGLSQYPVRIVDNRPQYMQVPSSVPDGVEQGDTLFAQPSHLTSATAPSSSSSVIMREGDPPHNLEPDPLDIEDLDLEANQAIEQGQAPAWSTAGREPTARASIRVGEISLDMAWTPGVDPPTIPPSIPLAPHTVLTLKGSALGAWRGHVWTPSQGDIIRHPPRVTPNPTIVAYRPLNMPPKGPALPSGVCMTLRPVGAWISTTRFDLTIARTPRFWLVHIESSPPSGSGELPLTAGQSFFLEWMGVEREWVRRPRFQDDLQQLGGYATIPEPTQPRPPTPPQRYHANIPVRRGPAAPRTDGHATPGNQSILPHQQQQQQQPQPQHRQSQTDTAKAGTASTITAAAAKPARASVKAVPKAKPPPPLPQPTSGSESETSWPSEDPVEPDAEHEESDLIQIAQHNRPTRGNDIHFGAEMPTNSTSLNTDEDDAAFVQRLPAPPPPEAELPPPCATTGGGQAEDNPAEEYQTDWMTVAHNFPQGFTFPGLLQILDKILGEILEHSFNLNSQYLTHLAYHAAFYVDKLTSLRGSDTPCGEVPLAAQEQAPEDSQTSLQEHMTVSFHIANPLSEIEATLGNLVTNYERLPYRHVRRELERVQAMLEESRVLFKKWAKDPTAPGALPGLAASGNAIDAVTFACLATEEGGLATMGEAIQVAHQATQRCSNYMDELVQWLQGRFSHDPHKESSPLKKPVEHATGSDQRPDFRGRPPIHSKRTLGQEGDELPPAKQRHGEDGPLGRGGETSQTMVHPPLPVHPRAPPGADPGVCAVPHHGGKPRPRGGNLTPVEAAPYHVLRAQQIIERLMPFMEQEAAVTLQDAHSLLFQWTTAIWGEPIMLTEEEHGVDAGGHLPPTYEQLTVPENDDSAAETVPFTPTEALMQQQRGGCDGGRTSSSTEPEVARRESHRRRRMHAALSDD